MTEPSIPDFQQDSSADKRAEADVRMRGFTRRSPLQEALAWLDRQLTPLEIETLPLSAAAGRVLAVDVFSQIDVPGFDRAMMDGLALRAADTSGASPYNHQPLEIIGQSLPGRPSDAEVDTEQAVQIMTGAQMPAGADAVLPFEQTELIEEKAFALGEVSPGKHVGRRGEDVSQGTKVFSAPRRLRPQDIGVLSSIALAEVEVYRRVRVRIICTGDELLPPGTMPVGTQIVDANGPMLSALVERDRGIVQAVEIVPDDPQAILSAMRQEADVVLISGGSSVGCEDHAPLLLDQHGELAIHGVAMRPSSPTGMGLLEGRLVFLLPGNPVSCLCAYDFFAGRAIRVLGGRRRDWPYRSVRLPLERKIVSTVGRVDYVRVSVVDQRVEPLSIGGASILSSTTRADGFVIVEADSEGSPPGDCVEVFLYDEA